MIQGIKQTYYPGYAVKMNRIIITTDENAPAVSDADPWKLRVFAQNRCENRFFTPILSVEGSSLFIDFIFSEEDTRAFSKTGDQIVVLEHGEEGSVIPRLFFHLSIDNEFKCGRPSQS